MNNQETFPCDGLIEYIAGEGSNIERKRFERHLASCSACKEEAAQLREVWDSLPDQAELLELPADLKDEVFRPLFIEEYKEPAGITYRQASRLPRFARIASWAAVLALVFMSGWMMRGIGVPNTTESAMANTAPTKIETLFHLSAATDNGKFTDHPRAYGVACMVRSDQQDQFVVYVFGTPQTQGSEAYQVWLWNDGKRHSAGTFTVDSSGIGIMTIPVTEQTPAVEWVSVSLEPDPYSSEPKGTKMFDSDEHYSAGLGLNLATIRSHLLG